MAEYTFTGTIVRHNVPDFIYWKSGESSMSTAFMVVTVRARCVTTHYGLITVQVCMIRMRYEQADNVR